MKKLWWLLLGLALLLVPGHPVQAVGSSFTIKPVYPNAVSQGRGYFDMTVKPGATVPLAVVVQNITSSTKKIRVTVADAYTGNSGRVGYDPSGPKDDSAKVRLSALAGKARTITLKANQQRKVTFTVHVPQKGLTGELMGSLYCIDLATYGDKGQGVALKNRFAMYTAVVMRTSTAYVHPDLHLKKFALTTRKGSAMAYATIQNYKPQAFGQMKIKASVYKDGGQKPVLTRTTSGNAMAPNSHFDFELPTSSAFTAGDYRLDLLATSGKRRWHFTRTIHVSSSQARTIDKAASLKMPGLPWWVILLIVLLIWIILLLLLLLLYLWRKKRREQAD